MGAEERLEQGMQRKLESRKHRLAILMERLDGMSPLRKLSQGYAFLTSDEGKTLRSVKQVKKGEKIRVSLADGEVQAKVTEIEEIVRR